MLVLSRRESEQIQLGENIELTIVRISGDRVQLGIAAPKELRVLRAELARFPEIAAARAERGVSRRDGLGATGSSPACRGRGES